MTKWIAIAAVASAVLVGCGGGGGGSGGVVSGTGGLLEGQPQDQVATAVRDVDVGDTYSADEISVDMHGRDILRTKLEITFRGSATVEDVNRLLTNLGATITTSTAGLPGVVVRLPDPGTLTALDDLVAQIEAEPFVWFVNPAVFPATDRLPDVLEGDSSAWSTIDHQLAVKAPAAWNAAARVGNTFPSVVVADYFGGGAPNGDLDYAGAVGFHTAETAHDHGYHVAGIIAGSFAGSGDDRGNVTGIYPDTVYLEVVDLTRDDPLDFKVRMLNTARDMPGTVVLSTSLAYGCVNAETCSEPDKAARDGAWYAMQVRARGLEERMLHVTSAGNIKPEAPEARDARINSFFTASALLGVLSDSDGNPVAPLSNVLVVENYRNTEDPPYAQLCLNASSYVGGTLGAVGTDVWSFTDATSAAGNKTGTSMATPQVAGLAAYLVALGNLTPLELKSVLLNTAGGGINLIGAGDECSDWEDPAPFINAYHAVLALDDGAVLDGGTDLSAMKVRGAILDLADGNGVLGESNDRFDQHDLAFWVDFLEPEEGTLDYGRYDLNGDGYTGGERKDAFDLDANRPPAFTTLEKEIAGETVSFDETALTDLQVLCYYAHSAVYTGDEDRRDELLEPLLDRCGVRGDLFAQIMEGAPGDRALYTSNASGAETRNLTETLPANPDFIFTWTRPGEIVFQADGSRNYLALDVSDGTLTDLGLLAPEDGYIEISPDYRHAVRWNASGDVYIRDLRTGQETLLFLGSEDLRGVGSATWSRDSRRVAMALCDYPAMRNWSQEDVHECVFELNVFDLGGSRTQVTDFFSQLSATADDNGGVDGDEMFWSPDGQKLWFRVGLYPFGGTYTRSWYAWDGASVLEVVRDDSPTSWPYERVYQPWSPDGNFVLTWKQDFSLGPDQGRLLLHDVAAADPGTELYSGLRPRSVRVANFSSMWSPDQGYLALPLPDNSIQVVDLTTGAVRQVLEASADRVDIPHWLSNSRELLYRKALDSVMRLDIVTGVEEFVTSTYPDSQIVVRPIQTSP